jgi:hypothetical protein
MRYLRAMRRLRVLLDGFDTAPVEAPGPESTGAP